MTYVYEFPYKTYSGMVSKQKPIRFTWEVTPPRTRTIMWGVNPYLQPENLKAIMWPWMAWGKITIPGRAGLVLALGGPKEIGPETGDLYSLALPHCFAWGWFCPGTHINQPVQNLFFNTVFVDAWSPKARIFCQKHKVGSLKIFPVLRDQEIGNNLATGLREMSERFYMYSGEI